MLEQAANIDTDNTTASVYYIANCTKHVNLNSPNFARIWKIEKNLREPALVEIVKYEPSIINKNSRFLRQLLSTAAVLDKDNKSAFYYALKAEWEVNYQSRMFHQIAESATTQQGKPLYDSLDPR